MAEAARNIEHPYIIKSPQICGGEPIIRGTRFCVRNVAQYILEEGLTPEELAKEFPQVSLAQIYDALSYYYDNMEEMRGFIEANREERWLKTSA